ncbi:organic solute transporter Ostalpha-domain-containing protein [Gymnopilus junonius]|uniref:Organic solute transporter Ostalpha-domain-containing protein n=1 Tax=Gymnopilus junonius TaxID=109634 RepID=A0A9P5TL07_GYMJU|nr:organic solute transporter Ostalpha-domain-containing protein [Gymnopilus junonius]
MSNSTNERCFKVDAPAAPPLFQNGKIVLQGIGWIISGSLTLVAVITSFWLISKQLQWYTNKKEQRYIVRLLFMVPLYAIISFGSFLFWNHATPIILLRDAYESIVLTAFFYLLLTYLSHDVEEQKRIFLKRGLSAEADAITRQKKEKPSHWVFPMGFVKWKPKDGLYFLQMMKWGVLQYCVIRPTTTLAAVILNYIGLYCDSSWGLGWGHIYITVIMSVSVTIAMFCLIQLYVPVAGELSERKPLLKLFSVKAVVFLTFWQATFLSLLSMFGIVKATQYMTADDVNVAIGAILEDFEMMIFAFLHIRAFSYLPYKESNSKGLLPSKTAQWRSLAHAMDFRETFREIWTGCIYMYDKMRGKEPKPDFSVLRESHYEEAFGRHRELPGRPHWSPRADLKGEELPEATFPTLEIEVDREIEIEGQKQWLLLDEQNRLHPNRERSEGLQEQFDKELERLGYPKFEQDFLSAVDIKTSRQRSWWRSIYNHLSQSGQEIEGGTKEPLKQGRLSRLRSYRYQSRNNTQLKEIDVYIDDQPPRSILPPVTFKPPSPRDLGHQEGDQNRISTRDAAHPPLPLNGVLTGRNQQGVQPVTCPSPVSTGSRSLQSPSQGLAHPNAELRTPVQIDPLPQGPYDELSVVSQANSVGRGSKFLAPVGELQLSPPGHLDLGIHCAGMLLFIPLINRRPCQIHIYGHHLQCLPK